MKTLPLLCIGLATTAHAILGLEVINQLANVLTIIPTLIGNFAKPVENQVTYSTAVGFNGVNHENKITHGEGTTSGVDGTFPAFAIMSADNGKIAGYTGLTKIKSGDKAIVKYPNIDGNQQHHHVNIYAGDIVPRWLPPPYKRTEKVITRDAICFRYIAVTPDQGQSDTKPYVVTAEMMIKLFGTPWYYSGENFNYFSDDGKCTVLSTPLPCVWMSSFKFDGGNRVEKITIEDVDKYRMISGTRPLDENALKKLIRVTYSQYPDVISLYEGDGRQVDIFKRAERDETVMIDSDLSAAALCVDETSQGPSFVSERERLYCDMKKRLLYPLCTGNVTSSCYQVNNDTVTIVAELSSSPKNGRSAKRKTNLPLRRFPRKAQGLHRRDISEPTCLRKEPFTSFTPAVVKYYISGTRAEGSDFDRIGERLGWMVDRSGREYELAWVDYSKGHDAKFTCFKNIVGSLAGCQKCIRYATDNSWSILQSHTSGRIDLNCGSIQYFLGRDSGNGGGGGDGSGNGGQCKRTLGRGDGKTAECCVSSDDCSGICDLGTKLCRPGNVICYKVNPYKYGLGKGDGRAGDCCANSDDCVSTCVNNECTGGGGGGGSNSCSGGRPGLKDGSGGEGACCATEADCKVCCSKSGVCNAACRD
ncbi:hypothetical protein BGW38_000302 [Lunasporangiospora selenospora]|uniref:Uncharacterized protein n=1 Tax=Lunasporangiospora selenospora TaxID=979761 RepID=A0A9P6G2F7_9FUNG|nr:hypothetical protein BGW38_000302 [Lunasporangiospora selenospora]